MAGKREIRKNKNPHFFLNLAPVLMAATKTGKSSATEFQVKKGLKHECMNVAFLRKNIL
jgi:hypothetical protein